MDVHDFLTMKPNFLASMGYHIFLTMVHIRAPLSRVSHMYNTIRDSKYLK